MSYITCKKGQVYKLSAYFNSTEFDCHGSYCCSTTVINSILVSYLDKIREHFGAPITITSGYRCPTHNKNVGGATGSRHAKGDAVDIVVSGVAPREVAKYAESIGILGIGLYETSSDGFFVHIDTRTTKSFWYGQAQQYRSTFGGNNIAPAPNTGATSSESNSSKFILARGSVGNEVRELQANLITLGYSCGSYGADGSFGASTEAAVRLFQNECGGIGVDGIAGYKTLTALNEAIKLNAFRVKLLNASNCIYSRAACCKHRVKNKNITLRNIGRQFAVVINGHMGFGVTVHTNMAHLCSGDKA